MSARELRSGFGSWMEKAHVADSIHYHSPMLLYHRWIANGMTG